MSTENSLTDEEVLKTAADPGTPRLNAWAMWAPSVLGNTILRLMAERDEARKNGPAERVILHRLIGEALEDGSLTGADAYFLSRAYDKTAPLAPNNEGTPTWEHANGDHDNGLACPDCVVCARLGWLDEGFDETSLIDPEVRAIVYERTGWEELKPW